MWVKPFVKSILLITVFRTLFYQFLLIVVGLAIGFTLNAEYIGWKSSIVAQSFNNIFFPVEFDQDVCRKLKGWGAFRIWAELDRPTNFKILEDGLAAEEFYIAKISYTNSNGKTITDIKSTRIRWKPWEYYYTDPTPLTEEELWGYIDNGTLNSKETDKAFKLRKEKMLNESAKIRT